MRLDREIPISVLFLPPGFKHVCVLFPFPLKKPAGEPKPQPGCVSVLLAAPAGQLKHVQHGKDATKRDKGSSQPSFWRGRREPGPKGGREQPGAGLGRDFTGQGRWEPGGGRCSDISQWSHPSLSTPPFPMARVILPHPPKPPQTTFVKGTKKSLFFSREAHKIYSTFLQTKVKKKSA